MTGRIAFSQDHCVPGEIWLDIQIWRGKVVDLVGRLPEKRNGHFSMDTLERYPSHTSETTDFNFSKTEAGLQNQPAS